jgi:hypothetical protein
MATVLVPMVSLLVRCGAAASACGCSMCRRRPAVNPEGISPQAKCAQHPKGAERVDGHRSSADDDEQAAVGGRARMKRRSAASAGGRTRSRGTPRSSTFADTVRPQGHASQRLWHGVVPSEAHGSEANRGLTVSWRYARYRPGAGGE